jgi:hypothetical protein
MKTRNINPTSDIFGQFILSTEEMICVRGGEDDPSKPTIPPTGI